MIDPKLPKISDHDLAITCAAHLQSQVFIQASAKGIVEWVRRHPALETEQLHGPRLTPDMARFLDELARRAAQLADFYRAGQFIDASHEIAHLLHDPRQSHEHDVSDTLLRSVFEAGQEGRDG